MFTSVSAYFKLFSVKVILLEVSLLSVQMFTITKASENIFKKFNNVAYYTYCAKMYSYEYDIIFAFFIAGGGSREGGH
jgi:hypothetical protein